LSPATQGVFFSSRPFCPLFWFHLTLVLVQTRACRRPHFLPCSFLVGWPQHHPLVGYFLGSSQQAPLKHITHGSTSTPHRG
jgi:hypothetical protein